jgi:hypothetical protein
MLVCRLNAEPVTVLFIAYSNVTCRRKGYAQKIKYFARFAVFAATLLELLHPEYEGIMILRNVANSLIT